MVWNAAHLHLMVNHLPVFAPVLAIPLLLLAYWKREEKAIVVGAVLLLLFGAIGGIISTRTGHGAETYVEGEPGVSMKALSIHEERGDIAAVTLNIVALVALAALWFMTNKPGVIGRNTMLVILLAGAIVASSMSGFAALKGGEIHHPEIRPPDNVTLSEASDTSPQPAMTGEIEDNEASDNEGDEADDD